MRFDKMIGVSAVALVAVGLAATAYGMGSRPTAKMAAVAEVPFATPAGIMIQPYGRTANDRYGVVQPEGLLVFSSADGYPLYTAEADPAGKSACDAECAKTWHAALATPGAKGQGNWSVIAREDGASQWAFKGKPLYIFEKDIELAKNPQSAPTPQNGRQNSNVSTVPQGWKVAYFDPGLDIKTPVGIIVQEIPDATGQGLVNDNGMTIYAYHGDAKKELATSFWTPVKAPLVANTLGDFTVVRRNDGSPQWAFRGAPLYTFIGDVQRGEANGIGAQDEVQVAELVKYYMPADITIRMNEGYGTQLATASGMSVYTRDRLRYNPGGNNARDGNHRTVARGRTLGTESCVEECLQQWKPVVASPDAQSRDYWQVVTRKDGTRQWAYRGYALYTYTGDKVPGDIKGNDLYDYVSRDKGMLRIADANTEAALFWRIGIP